METELPKAHLEGSVRPGTVPSGAAARKRAAIELIRSHGPALKATARRYSICLDDADDAYQRGLEILLEKAPSTETRALVPWARTVIKHEALAVRRGRERTLSRPPAPAASEGRLNWVELIPSEREGPEEQTVGREKLARSREALARLKPQELKALTQLAEGYSYAEIGAMNDWTRTKVNRCLAEGRQRFRSAFRESETGKRCDALRPLLSACCDGELDRAGMAEVEDHLAACGGCRATLRAYRAAPKAAAALAPLLPVSRGLWGRVQELVVAAHGKVHSIGDPSGAGAGTAGAARGAAPAAAAKVAAICAGTGATAALCVATGVLPAPVLNVKPESRPDRSPEPVVRAEPAAPVVVEPGNGKDPARSGFPAGSGRVKSRPNRRESKPPPTPTETEFTPEAAGTPVAAPPPVPAAPAAKSSGGGGASVPVGGGGEFGP